MWTHVTGNLPHTKPTREARAKAIVQNYKIKQKDQINESKAK